MPKIHYCHKCGKASREHLFRMVNCSICSSTYETINISRSRYYIIQFFFLMLGFIFMISAFVLTNPSKRAYEFLGISMIGISMWIFTLYFQMLDSKDMEVRAEQRIMSEKYEQEDTKKPFKDITAKPRPEKLADDEDDEGDERKKFWEKREAAPPPKVTRIRRALPGTGSAEPARPKLPERREARSPPPIVIRDMSVLLSGEDEEEDEIKPKKKKKKAKK